PCYACAGTRPTGAGPCDNCDTRDTLPGKNAATRSFGRILSRVSQLSHPAQRPRHVRAEGLSITDGGDYHTYHIAPRSETGTLRGESQNGGGSAVRCGGLRFSRVYVRNSSTGRVPASFARVPRALIPAINRLGRTPVATKKAVPPKAGRKP